MRVDKETIWHFTCDHCHGWWSIANSDDWVPKKLYCPHCGRAEVRDGEIVKDES